MGGVGAIQRDLSLRPNLFGGAEVHRRWGVHSDTGMAMVVITGQKETLAERARVFQGPEPVGESA